MILFVKVYNQKIVRRAPIFAFEFENPLFEFVAVRPQIEPLFELPPTRSSVTTMPFIIS